MAHHPEEAVANGFCCHGCETVFELLKRHDLSDYYRLKDQSLDLRGPGPVHPATETYTYCDDPSFTSSAACGVDGREMDFYVEGMSCTACVWLLEKLPEICADAEASRASLGSSRLRVRRTGTGSFAGIAQTLDRLGYRPHPITTREDLLEAERREDRRDLMRIGVAGFGTGNVMIHAVSLYAGAEGSLADGFRWLSALIALPVLTYAAWPFYRSAWGALRSRQLNIDVPITAAVLAGLIISAYGLIVGAETLYFDSLSMLVFLLLSSRFWLKRVRRRHLDATDLERHLLSGSVVRRLPSGDRERVSSLSVTKDDVLELHAGETIPVDGVLLEGQAWIETAVMTGEAAPRRFRAGEGLQAGMRIAQNAQAPVLLKSIGRANESRLARILRDAESAAREKPRLLERSERVSRLFVVIVLTAAALLFASLAVTDPAEGARRALALIIVTCPCVFGMAIPLSLSLAVREAARLGLIIKDPDVIERLSSVRVLAFDKTGTLSEGDLRVRMIEIIDRNPAHLAAAYALEAGQPHPVARALCEILKENADSTLGEAEDVAIAPGRGIEGRINGRLYAIRPVGRALAHGTNADGDDLLATFALECDGNLVARFDIGDRLKTGAHSAIQELNSRGLETLIISGDHPDTVRLAADQLGLSSERTRSRLSPEEKVDLVRSLGPGGAMIGDGANDAGALAAAHVGIAVHGAMDVSLRAADVYLVGSDLSGLDRLFEIARLTRFGIRRNLAISASFNLIAGSLAAMGLMAPLWAAVLMPLSSLTVLLSALAIGRRIRRTSAEADRARSLEVAATARSGAGSKAFGSGRDGAWRTA